ncbi:immediate early response 3-interacting protein 1 [Nematocida sp. AWRm77]|nr:immediate early response 3-interacting protein 1 [Nematocida sp. AWRm77]
MFGFATIVYIFTMLGNAVCILNEERFLRNVGVTSKSPSLPVRQLAELLRTVKTLFVIPLIFVNCGFMLYEFFLG